MRVASTHPAAADERVRTCVDTNDRPLRIALVSYRSKPHCGGQGIYLRHLSRELAGEDLDVVAERGQFPGYVPQVDALAAAMRLAAVRGQGDPERAIDGVHAGSHLSSAAAGDVRRATRVAFIGSEHYHPVQLQPQAPPVLARNGAQA